MNVFFETLFYINKYKCLFGWKKGGKKVKFLSFLIYKFSSDFLSVTTYSKVLYSVHFLYQVEFTGNEGRTEYVLLLMRASVWSYSISILDCLMSRHFLYLLNRSREAIFPKVRNASSSSSKGRILIHHSAAPEVKLREFLPLQISAWGHMIAPQVDSFGC